MTPTHAPACTVCGKEYPYRKGKQYCSQRCKQKAHVASKNGMPPTISQTPPVATFDFSLSEFRELGKEYGWGIPVHVFCFLRRGLRKDADLEAINEYMNSFYAEDGFRERIENLKAFQTFTEEFFGGKYSVG